MRFSIQVKGDPQVIFERSREAMGRLQLQMRKVLDSVKLEHWTFSFTSSPLEK